MDSGLVLKLKIIHIQTDFDFMPEGMVVVQCQSLEVR